jgi:hypothetical protein
MGLIDPVLDGLKKEAQTVPWTVFTLFLLTAFVAFSGVYYVYEVRPEAAAAHSAAISAQTTAVELKQKVSRIERSLLEQRILDAKIQQCTASTVESRQFFQARLQELMTDYQSLVGIPYQMPDCEALK